MERERDGEQSGFDQPKDNPSPGKLTSSPSMKGNCRASARYLATVLLPQPAGPVTSHMWWPFAGDSLVGVAPLVRTPSERPGVVSRADFGEGGMLLRPVAMPPGDEGFCPLTETGLLQESMVTANEYKRN